MTKIRLLLAEDDTDHQRLLLRALAEGRPSLDVKLVASASEFLEAVREEAFSCIITDYSLGADTASEILRQAGDALRDVPVIVVSSNTSQSVVIESIRRGVADYVPKHEAIEPGYLWKRVQSAMDQCREARRERRRAERRIRELRLEADRDALTGLWNRRYAVRQLATPFWPSGDAIVMVDIDRFKSVNDRYGHQAGDEVICYVAGMLRAAASKADAVVRWGGEEFMVIKTSCDPVSAWIWADQVRRRISNGRVEVGGNAISITISAGVASGPGLADELVRAADLALYQAKGGGRDRVCTSRMVQLLSTATQIGEHAGTASPIERARAFVASVEPDLGTTQREHLGPHSEHTSEVAVSLAGAMNVSAATIEEVSVGAAVHDIGKAGVPEALLAKTGPLSEDEKRFVDEHVRLGVEIAHKLGMPAPIIDIISSHHTRYDNLDRGGGATLDKTACAIVSVADAVAAMAQDRPYVRRRPANWILAELERQGGGQFDPRVVHAARQAGCVTEVGEDPET